MSCPPAATGLRQPLLLSRCCSAGTSAPGSVCRKFLAAVAVLPDHCSGGLREHTGLRQMGGWEVSSFPPPPPSPAKSCFPHPVPEESSFPNFCAHQEQGNPVAGGDGGERTEHSGTGRGLRGSCIMRAGGGVHSQQGAWPPLSTFILPGWGFSFHLLQVTAGDLAVLWCPCS